MVGAKGFEPSTPPSRTVCATRLRHAPKLDLLIFACVDVSADAKNFLLISATQDKDDRRPERLGQYSHFRLQNQASPAS